MPRTVLLYFLIFLFGAWANRVDAQATLEITNQTRQEIINIQGTPLAAKPIFFLRLDLDPDKSEILDNPACVANLRVDTGLEFWFFDNVPLQNISRLIFCGEHPACIAVGHEKDSLLHIGARVENLVPQPGQKMVCELSSFRPLMPMGEVCSILDPDLPRDDNSALLTGLGFAGMLWAARLVPTQNGPVEEDSRLEHLELRRPFSIADMNKLLEYMQTHGYVPWQAEFPDVNIDFDTAEGPGLDRQKALLNEAIKKFQDGYSGAKDKEWRLLMAPAAIIGQLANADAPSSDVQLFTIIFRHGVLIVDVAAYQGEKEEVEDKI